MDKYNTAETLPKRITVSIKPTEKTDIKITNTIVEVNTSDYGTYQGSYVVKPSTTQDQELPTKNKVLKNNITVERFPIWETSNESGVTFYIGGE